VILSFIKANKSPTAPTHFNAALVVIFVDGLPRNKGTYAKCTLVLENRRISLE